MHADIHALSMNRTHDPTFECEKTAHALDHAATVIGSHKYAHFNWLQELFFIVILEFISMKWCMFRLPK
jgi:hypothetical protein